VLLSSERNPRKCCSLLIIYPAAAFRRDLKLCSTGQPACFLQVSKRNDISLIFRLRKVSNRCASVGRSVPRTDNVRPPVFQWCTACTLTHVVHIRQTFIQGRRCFNPCSMQNEAANLGLRVSWPKLGRERKREGEAVTLGRRASWLKLASPPLFPCAPSSSPPAPLRQFATSSLPTERDRGSKKMYGTYVS
jgi:hypothetical protein